MPSIIVHLAFAGLLAAALLGDAFGKRSLAVVFLVTAFADLDSFVPYAGTTGHRFMFHNIVIPVAAALVLYVVIRQRPELRNRWTGWHTRVAAVALFSYVFAHVGLDLVDGYINLFWPVYDQFYTMRGVLELSDQRGIIQTFSDGGLPFLDPRGSVSDVRITTGVDPGPSVDGSDPERNFPIFRAGWQVMLFLVGTIAIVGRFVLPTEVGSD